MSAIMSPPPRSHDGEQAKESKCKRKKENPYVQSCPSTRPCNSDYSCRHRYTRRAHPAAPCLPNSCAIGAGPPEAAGGDGAFLGVGREVSGGATVRVEGHAGGGGEGAEEAIEEAGHRGGHYEDEEGEEEGGWGRQFERWVFEV